MQVDPIKPTLKASGTKRLKLKRDELLSSFAFNFNLRRFTEDPTNSAVVYPKARPGISRPFAQSVLSTP